MVMKIQAVLAATPVWRFLPERIAATRRQAVPAVPDGGKGEAGELHVLTARRVDADAAERQPPARCLSLLDVTSAAVVAFAAPPELMDAVSGLKRVAVVKGDSLL